MTDVIKKLATCEASLKRWHTRLTRASNMVVKLERQRRRLAGTVAYLTPAPGRVKIKEIPALAQKGALASIPNDEVVAMVTEAIGYPPVNADDDGLKVPAFLDRSDPLIAERMTAARKKSEEAARHAMPLTGKAALDHIKGKRKKA